jgi:choline monooxygenase
MTTEAIEWSVEDQEAGYSLPARFFYDESVFKREKTRIFFKSWHLAAHKNELREPGAFVTLDVFEQCVIVVAGRDGELRAFHNV